MPALLGLFRLPGLLGPDRIGLSFAGWRFALSGLVLGWLLGCNNNPYPPGEEATNTLFSAVVETSPRHLDPTASVPAASGFLGG